jgi:hypothetical protein
MLGDAIDVLVVALSRGQSYEGGMRDEYEPRARFRLTPLGMRRFPKLRSLSGVSAIRVMFDGSTTPSTLHSSYITMEEALLEEAAG